MDRKKVICNIVMFLFYILSFMFYWLMSFIELAFFCFVCAFVLNTQCNYGKLGTFTFGLSTFVTLLFYLKTRFSTRELINSRIKEKLKE